MVLGMPMTWTPRFAQIFRQEGGVGVGVVAPHHHQAVQLAGRHRSAGTAPSSAGCRSCPGRCPACESRRSFCSGPPFRAVTSTCWLVMMPLGPARKPMSTLSGWSFLAASKTPAMTLCPPGAGPPERTMPRRRGPASGSPCGRHDFQQGFGSRRAVAPGHLEDVSSKPARGRVLAVPAARAGQSCGR